MFAHGTTTGTNPDSGIVLGIHPRSNIILKWSISDPLGHYIVAECCSDDEFFTVASVYIHPKLTLEELNEFLSEVAKKVDSFGHDRVLWMGDFNISLNADFDSNNPYQSTLYGKRNALLSFMETHELTDIWHAMNLYA